MTYGGTHNRSNPRREEAREKARMIREQQRKMEKRGRALVKGIIVLGSIVVIGTVAIIILSSLRSPSPGPLNMRSDGILIGEGFVAVQTRATPPGQSPIPTSRDENSEVIAIELYVDYFSPLSSSFEEANGEQLATWVEAGAATIEVHPLAILDRVSQGTKYSTRATNAAACVANFSPDQFYAFHTLLLQSQPEENTTGLSDEELAELAIESEVTSPTQIRECIEDQDFVTWVVAAKDRALTGPIPNSDVAAISSTPTIIVNGLRYDGAPNDSAAFSAFVVLAAGRSFNESSTSTPTPAPLEAVVP